MAHSQPVLAGALAAVLFTTSHIPMLVRACTTKDLRSYSLGHLVVSNLGNAVYWIYVSALPFGPIWLMHGFYTVSTALMLACYLRYTARGPHRFPTATEKPAATWSKPA